VPSTPSPTAADLVPAIEEKLDFRGKKLVDVRGELRAKEARYKKLWDSRLTAQMVELPEFAGVYRSVRRALRQAGLTAKQTEMVGADALDPCSYTWCTTLMARPPWRITAFDWDEANLEYVAHHGVEDYEVEEVFDGSVYVRRVRDVYTVLGASSSGRRLFVVIARKEGGVVRPVTARDMTHSERRLYEKRGQ